MKKDPIIRIGFILTLAGVPIGVPMGCGGDNSNTAPSPAAKSAEQPSAALPGNPTGVTAQAQSTIAVGNRILLKVGKPWITMTQTGTTSRIVSEGVQVEFRKSGLTYEIVSGENTYRTKLDGEKIKVTDKEGRLVLKVKIRPDKTKVYRSSDDTFGWSIKPKDGGFKIKQGEQEMGKIKIKPDKGEMQVRLQSGETLCTMQGQQALPAAAVCLMSNLTQEQQLIAFGLLSLF